MKWIKDAFLDVIIFGIIVAYSISFSNTIEIILWVYTSFLLVGKILYYFIDFLKSKASKSKVPNWFYHFIYISSITILLLSKNYYLSIAWVLIWILSFATTLFKKNIASK